jgi:hypothetical protein
LFSVLYFEQIITTLRYWIKETEVDNRRKYRAVWHGKRSATDLITGAKDRELWRGLITNACLHSNGMIDVST